MRTHGWDSKLPASDEEARRRIIDAAMSCVDRYGAAKTSLSDVAVAAGVTRKTVYRYFSSTEELFIETGRVAADGFVEGLMNHVASFAGPVDALVEAAAYAIENLPRDGQTGVLIASGHADVFALGVLSDESRRYAAALLSQIVVERSLVFKHGVTEGDVVDLILRLIQSFVIDSGTVTGEGLRSFLRIWVAAVVERSVV